MQVMLVSYALKTGSTSTTEVQHSKITYEFKTPTNTPLLQPSEMAFLSNSRWQNRIERPNRYTNNGEMTRFKGKGDITQ